MVQVGDGGLMEIKGQLIKVGTLLDCDTRINVRTQNPRNGEVQIVSFACSPIQAKEFAPRLYKSVVIRIEICEA